MVQNSLQVPDDLELLELMMKDQSSAPEKYRPTNYWDTYEKMTMNELRHLGLRDFRRRRRTMLDSFGAVDVRPVYGSVDPFQFKFLWNRFSQRSYRWERMLVSLGEFLTKKIPLSRMYALSFEDFHRHCYEYVALMAERYGSRPLSDFSVSLAGAPEDAIKIGDSNYCMSSYINFIRYIYCSRFFDFEFAQLIVELGSGSGRQIELLRKMFPKCSFIACDIAPQLYVAQRYLDTVFPGSVISYTETRSWSEIPDLKPGQIAILGTFQFPLLSGIPTDLFWNAASFQEMEPNVVLNYLETVQQSAKNVYLMEKMDGKELAAAKGKFGVLEPTTERHYREGLSEFACADMSDYPVFIYSQPGYRNSFWKRQN